MKRGDYVISVDGEAMGTAEWDIGMVVGAMPYNRLVRWLRARETYRENVDGLRLATAAERKYAHEDLELPVDLVRNVTCGCKINAPEANPAVFACPCGDHCTDPECAALAPEVNS